MKTAAQLWEGLEEAAIASFRLSPKFGGSLEQQRATARRSNPLPKFLIEFLDFQERWESALQRPLFEELPFQVEVGDVAPFFNNEEAREWLFPFARSAGGMWASWLWEVPIQAAPVVLFDTTRREFPRIIADDIAEFFRHQTAQLSGESEIERDFIAWAGQHLRVLVLPPTAQVTEWPLPNFPDFQAWCRQLMR